MNIGFIGTGIMGKSMVRNLHKAGNTVQIYARHPEKVQDLAAEGIKLCNSISECAQNADAVFTIVGFPSDVEEVYCSEDGLLATAAPGTYLVDMTTSSPKLAKKLYEEGQKKGLHVMDAPVTGGEIGAKNGTLSILIGGDKEDLEAIHSLYEAMGTVISYQGQAGMGQHAKLANQIMIAGSLSGICEALTYAKAKGLELPVFLEAVQNGAAGSKQLNAVGSKILVGDDTPSFLLKHFAKDLRLAAEEADLSELALEMLPRISKAYNSLVEVYGEKGTQALFHYYEK